MKFLWIGGPSFVLDLGPFCIVGDPVFADQFEVPGAGTVTRVSPRPEADVSRADAVLVTSLCADHFDPAAIAACDAATTLVPAGGETRAPGAKAFGAGDTLVIEKNDTKLTIAGVPAGHAAQRGTGYFLTLHAGERPFTAYVTGDTRFSDETREVQRTHGYSNLLVIHLGAERDEAGGWRSCDSKDAMQIVYRMQPNAIAAVHHATFSHYTEPIDPFVARLGFTIYEKRLRVLREGESFEKLTGPVE